MNIAIILAGGKGSRIDSEVPKQFIKIHGQMMITHALLSFGKSELVDNIQIVADEAWREKIEFEMFEDPKSPVGQKFLGFSDPGENRQMSIFNAMKDLKNMFGPDGEKSDKRPDSNHDASMPLNNQNSIDGIIIHDAARPFVTVECIDECLRTLDEHDGVMPVLPMKDTVYFSRSGKRVDELLNRNFIYAGQAPEAFLFDKYYHANEELLPDRILLVKGSSEAAVMSGLDIAMIPGDQRNFKVTTNEDLERAKELLGP